MSKTEKSGRVPSRTPNKRPTLHDVARLSGVSHMTVSRVMRDSQAVTPITKAKVRAAIASIGYQPDPALSALAAYRANMLSRRRSHGGLAFLDCDGTEFSRAVLAGVRSEASLYGYRVDSYALPADKAGQGRLGRTLFHRGIRGLCFGPSDRELDLQGWDWTQFAVVTLGALAHRPALHAVAMDYFDGAFSACRMLLDRGCRRIGFVVETRLQARTGHRWLGGYVAGLQGGRPLIYQSEQPTVSGIENWLRLKRIDGLLTIHAGLLRGRWLRPEANVCLLNATTSPIPDGLTRLSLDPGRIGAEGVRFLHHLLLRCEYGVTTEPRTVSLRGKWLLHPTSESSPP